MAGCMGSSFYGRQSRLGQRVLHDVHKELAKIRRLSVCRERATYGMKASILSAAHLSVVAAGE